MDNLELLKHQSTTLDQKYYSNFVSCHFLEGIVSFMSEEGIMCIYDHSHPENLIKKEIEIETIHHIQYLASRRVFFLGSDHEIILCNRNTLQCSLCYLSEKKIISYSWNPTETSVVYIDEENKIFLCNFSLPKFEMQYNNELNAKVPDSVYVGWGSADTQFKGPNKSSTKLKEIDSSPDLKYSPPKISWRGNGEQFAVNFFRNGRRLIKVFDNHLQPLFESIEFSDLSDTVSFMFAGQSIVTATVGDTKKVVVLEKNCKVKVEFEVPENKGTIIKTLFHPQMNLLAVYSRDKEDCGYVNIYLYTNGEWVLKQQLLFSAKRIVRDFSWVYSNESLYTVCRLVIFTTQNVEQYTFRFIVNRYPDTAILACVVGKTLLWYNFADEVIPPPLSNHVTTFSAPINRVIFSPQNFICVVIDSKWQVTVFDLKTFTALLVCEIGDLDRTIVYHDISWGVNTIKIKVMGKSKNVLKKQEMGNLTLEIQEVPTNRKIALPYNDVSDLSCPTYMDVDSDSNLIYLTRTLVPTRNSQEKFEFTLSRYRDLYLNGRLLQKDVTSLVVFQHYLILTTSEKMHCIRLAQDYVTLLNGTFDWETSYSREVEHCSRIVTVAGGTPPQIFMMLLRGNLETVTCRLLTIDVIEELLQNDKWEAALEVTRLEKMNWNILVDLRPLRFYHRIKEFVEAAMFCGKLSTIVNEFTEKKLSYDNCLPKILNAEYTEYDKIEIVKAIISYLSTTDLNGNLLSIVSIEYKHFSLKSAMSYIKVLFEKTTSRRLDACKSALEYLKSKAHFKDILEVTYSLFNVDFLAFVYSQSLEDPKVYKPEIKDLRKLEPLRLRFEMSSKAKNFEEAVTYLLRCDNCRADFVEDFITQHQLEAVAYKSVPFCYGHFRLVSTLYAKCLTQKKNYIEAAVVYKQADMTQEALEEYKKALEWREVLSIMTLLRYTDEQRRETLEDLATRLAQAHRVEEAALLLDKYNNDHIKAIKLLVDHKLFRTAVCIAKERNELTIIEELDEALSSYTSSLEDKITESEALFKRHFDRLQEVRETKLQRLNQPVLQRLNRGIDEYPDVDSVMSDSSRASTSKTRSSQFSSRSKRKEARKKIDLRVGGFYEDIALIRSLHMLYSTVFGLGKEVRELCLIMENKEIETVKGLHNRLRDLQDFMKKHVSLIWCDVFIKEPEVLDNAALSIVGNKAELDPKYCVPPGEDMLSQDWKLDIFS